MFGCQDNPIWLVVLLAAIFLGKICLGYFPSQKSGKIDKLRGYLASLFPPFCNRATTFRPSFC